MITGCGHGLLRQVYCRGGVQNPPYTHHKAKTCRGNLLLLPSPLLRVATSVARTIECRIGALSLRKIHGQIQDCNPCHTTERWLHHHVAVCDLRTGKSENRLGGSEPGGESDVGDSGKRAVKKTWRRC